MDKYYRHLNKYEVNLLCVFFYVFEAVTRPAQIFRKIFSSAVREADVSLRNGGPIGGPLKPPCLRGVTLYNGFTLFEVRLLCIMGGQLRGPL